LRMYLSVVLFTRSCSEWVGSFVSMALEKWRFSSCYTRSCQKLTNSFAIHTIQQNRVKKLVSAFFSSGDCYSLQSGENGFLLSLFGHATSGSPLLLFLVISAPFLASLPARFRSPSAISGQPFSILKGYSSHSRLGRN
jgi:hypothetical protein